MGWFNYFRVYSALVKELRFQKKFNQRFLIPYLNELEKKYDGKFTGEQRHKILSYYGLFITAFLCSSYKRLQGGELSEEERKRATLFGILTPVGDDLFDIDQLDHSQIEAITFDPENYCASTFLSRIAKEIQSYLIASVPDKQAYLLASKNVLEIQKATVKQTIRSTPKAEIEKITYDKGGYSVIIYREILEPAADNQLLDALYYVGSLYQLGNDLFDLYKDTRDGIYTLINTCDDFAELRSAFLQRVALQNEKIRSLPFDETRKKEFLIMINTINARSLVALDQFCRQQQTNMQPTDWFKAKREEMIVDMEKPSNFFNWLKYIGKLNKI